MSAPSAGPAGDDRGGAPATPSLDAADARALEAAAAAQRTFARTHLRVLPPGLPPAFRFDPDA